MSVIEIDGVTKRFGDVEAVAPTSLAIRENEFFALLGPSGCGKTTLLRMIAGFEAPSAGRIIIAGEDMTMTPPNKRPVNMVFQSYAVFPHMSVAENVGYGLRVTGVSASETATRVGEALERVGLSDFTRRKPDQLSGGQRQRVALARALVKRPKVMLLDEPLSALDAKLREDLQIELATLQIEVGITFVMVTHDQDEALSMADTVAVMNAGRVAQIGDPADIYESPQTRFVADFIGRVNLIKGSANGGQIATDFGSVSLAAPDGAITLGIRPEKIRLAPSGGSVEGEIRATGKIAQWAYYGDQSRMIVDVDGQRLSVVLQNETRGRVHDLDIGNDVALGWSAADMLVLPD